MKSSVSRMETIRGQSGSLSRTETNMGAEVMAGSKSICDPPHLSPVPHPYPEVWWATVIQVTDEKMEP